MNVSAGATELRLWALTLVTVVSCSRTDLTANGTGEGPCRRDDDCPPMHSCVDGICRGIVGAACVVDTDCATDLACLLGTCQNDPCSQPDPRADANGRCLRACSSPTSPEPCTSGGCYYIAASGGSDANTGDSPTSPWESFEHAWSVVQPGDTLNLMDGTYRVTLEPTVSGAPGSPITIRAHHDGEAVIDGELVRPVCRFFYVSDLVIEGIRCENMDASAVNSGLVSVSWSSKVTLRRVTASESTSAAPLVQVYQSSDIVVEDCAAWGTSSTVFSAYSADRLTFRRLWAEMPSPSPIDSYAAGVSLYRSSDAIVENCIVMHSSAPSTYSAIAFPVVSNDIAPADRNRILGNIVLGDVGWSYHTSAGRRLEENQFVNNAAIDAQYGMFQRADADMLVRRLTTANAASTCFRQSAESTQTYPPEFAISAALYDSVFLSGGPGFSRSEVSGIVPVLLHDYNVLWGVTTPYAGGLSQATHEWVDEIEPLYDTGTFGNGAYLIAPTNLSSSGDNGGPIGAEILYRYRDGELTCVPLWPWPMEDRIMNERGISVTWENGGGLWKTLDGAYPIASRVRFP